MTGPSRFRGFSAFALAALVLLAGGAAQGAIPPPPDDDSLKLDAQVQTLKDETLKLNAELGALEEQVLFPNHTRTTLYVAVKISGFMLQDISLTVDDGEPVPYHYTPSEQRAFGHDGYHRIQRLALQPGSHRLHAEFSGRFFDAPPSDRPVTGKIDTTFEKGPRELDLVLPISRNSRMDRPGLPEVRALESVHKRETRAVWLPEPEKIEQESQTFVQGGTDDPRYRSALFLKWDGRYFSALLELDSVLARTKDVSKLPADFWWLMGDCYVSYGMDKPAQELYRRMIVTGGDPDIVARARIRLANFEYDRGYYAQAAQTLMRVRERLSVALLPEWQEALAQVLLAQGRYNETVEILTEGQDPDKLPLYMRYNLGVALMNDGKVVQGRAVLDRVGTTPPASDEDLALRDKANLALAYHFLQSQQGATAKPIFERVRVNGPFANRALLGLGWSELAPRGQAQERGAAAGLDKPAYPNSASLATLLRPGYLDSDVYRRLGLRPFRQGKTAKVEDQQLRNALTPWSELVTRDSMDPAVQEGLLAIPYAMNRLGAQDQALQLYQRAIDTLEATRKRLDGATNAIRQGRMVSTMTQRDPDSEKGWMWRVSELADTDETYFLQNLLAQNRYQEALKNYRDVRFLSRNLEGWRIRLNNFGLVYAQQSRPSLDTAALFASARDNWEAPWGPIKLRLREETSIAPPGSHDAPLNAPNPWQVKLALAATPSRFEGVLEKIPELGQRIELLRPRLASAGTQQAQNLQTIAIKELDGQKKTIDRYLVEARFAVARLYDTALKNSGGAGAPLPPSTPANAIPPADAPPGAVAPPAPEAVSPPAMPTPDAAPPAPAPSADAPAGGPAHAP